MMPAKKIIPNKRRVVHLREPLKPPSPPIDRGPDRITVLHRQTTEAVCALFRAGVSLEGVLDQVITLFSSVRRDQYRERCEAEQRKLREEMRPHDTLARAAEMMFEPESSG